MSCLSENCIFKSLALKTNAIISISLFLLSLSAVVNAEPQTVYTPESKVIKSEGLNKP